MRLSIRTCRQTKQFAKGPLYQLSLKKRTIHLVIGILTGHCYLNGLSKKISLTTDDVNVAKKKSQPRTSYVNVLDFKHLARPSVSRAT